MKKYGTLDIIDYMIWSNATRYGADENAIKQLMNLIFSMFNSPLYIMELCSRQSRAAYIAEMGDPNKWGR